MEEQWKRIIIDGMESNYEISTLGRGRNITKLNWKSKGILTPKFNKSNGYYSYQITINKKRYYKYIHRLVAEAFLERTEERDQVNHIDGDKSNNIITNLEWCTGKENMKHCFDNELCSTSKPVILYTLKGVRVGEFLSISDAIRFIDDGEDKRVTFGIDCRVLEQKEDNTNCQAMGYQWRYRDDDIRPVYNIKETCSRSNIPIVKLTLDGEFVKRYDKMHEAYKDLGKRDNGAISQVCKGNRRYFNDFKWMYLDEWQELVQTTNKN